MPEDLPIYSNTMLRTGLQFADLARFKDLDLSRSLVEIRRPSRENGRRF